jgi:hypothetical protein
MGVGLYLGACAGAESDLSPGKAFALVAPCLEFDVGALRLTHPHGRGCSGGRVWFTQCEENEARTGSGRGGA